MDKKLIRELPQKIAGCLKKYKYAFLVLLIGAALLLLPFGKKEQEQAAQPAQTEPAETDYARQTEDRLTEILLQIEGAGRVRVMLTLARGAETQYQCDTKTSSEQTSAGTQTTQERKTVILSQGSAYDEAAISSVIYPQFQGALIVSEGADNAAVRWNILCAVSALTGLGADRITVVKMK